MRIEFVTDTFPPDINGVAMTLGRLVAGLRARGHLVYVWHTSVRNDTEKVKGETSLPSFSLPGYREVRVGLPGRLKLLRRWRKRTPDAVYVATESLLGYSAIKAANTLKIPVVAGFHTNFDQYLERYKLPRLKPAALSYLRKVHEGADLTFAPSQEVVNRLEQEGFGKVRLLGRGVDTELYSLGKRNLQLRRELGADVDGPTPLILMVGRVAAEKNLDFGLKVFRKMKERVAGTRCVVVGDGPVREMLAKAYSEVSFVGAKEGEELAKYYASCDILLFPSETETFGNVLLEGLASGLVTVSYDYAAAANHVGDGRNGYKASFGDEQAFLDSALNALDDVVADRAEIRESAVASISSLSWEGVVQTFEKEVRDLTRGLVNARAIGRKKPHILAFRTIFLSDIHLGTEDSKAKEVLDFLKHTTCQKLVLNGDIIDGWALKRGSRWRKRHSKVVRYLFKIMERKETEVIYVRGNHDDVLERFLPLNLGLFKVVKEHLHKAENGKCYLVTHGDGFDKIVTNYKWLARLGAIGYDQLMRLNRLLNRYRAWRGKESYSVSKVIKARVKGANTFVDRYQQQLQALAKRRDCEGIICGHIHTPANEQVEGVHYLNSGDWVESLSCVVENLDGSFEVLYYEEFLKRLHDEVEDLAQEEVAKRIVQFEEWRKSG